MNLSFSYVGYLLFLVVGVVGTTIVGSSSTQAWADVIEGTEGPDEIVGTPGEDVIDSKGGNDFNFGDTFRGDGSGDDVILSGEGSDGNYGDTREEGVGSGEDKIITGDADNQSTGNGGADTFVCGGGEDTITDYDEAEGDSKTEDCENF